MIEVNYQTGDVIETQVIGGFYGVKCMNVLYWTLRSPFQYETDFAAAVRANFCNLIKGAVTADFVWGEVNHRRIDPTETDYVRTPIQPLAGTANAGAKPHQMATVWILRTNVVIGAAKRGRIFLPAVPDAHWITGNYTAAGINAQNTAIANLRNAVALSGSSTQMGLGVCSRAGGGVTWHAVTNITLSLYLGTMRSRRPGHGD